MKYFKGFVRIKSKKTKINHLYLMNKKKKNYKYGYREYQIYKQIDSGGREIK